MKIGVFVGSFDPVHTGHVNIMNYLIEQKIVDQVIVVATGNYWHKQNITDLKLRLEMLDLIKSDRIIIDHEHNNLTYTYQVLEALEQEMPKDELYLVIGADNANTIHKWKCYDKIIKHGIIVIGRDNIKITLKTNKLIIIDKNFGNISSTKIRNNPADFKVYLDSNVHDYIKRNKLYGYK